MKTIETSKCKYRNCRTLVFAAMLALLASAALPAAAQSGGQPAMPDGKWVAYAPGCAVNVAQDLPGVKMALWWDGEKYVAAADLAPGLGYFLIPSNPGEKPKTKSCNTVTRKARDITLALHKGWNLLGNPTVNNISVGRLAQKTDGAKNVAFGAAGQKMEANTSSFLRQGDVAWIYSETDTTLSYKNVFNDAQISKITLSFSIPTENGGRLVPGGTLRMDAMIYFSDGTAEIAAASDFDWSVDNENVVKITAPGILEALAPGAFRVTTTLRGTSSSGTRDSRVLSDCDSLCISLIVPMTTNITDESVRNFADNMNDRYLGALPRQENACAFMEFNGGRIISVNEPAIAIPPENTKDVVKAKAYCLVHYDTGEGGLKTIDMPNAAGVREKVYLRDVTAASAFEWDNREAVSIAADGAISPLAGGVARLKAKLGERISPEAVVGVEPESAISISLAPSKSNGPDYADIAYYKCSVLPSPVCEGYGNESILTLPLSKWGRVMTTVSYNTMRTRYNPDSLTWQISPDSQLKIDKDGNLSAQDMSVANYAGSRFEITASMPGVSSNALVVGVSPDIVKNLEIMNLKRGNTTYNPRSKNPMPDFFIMAGDAVTIVVQSTSLFGKSELLTSGFRLNVTDATGTNYDTVPWDKAGIYTVTASKSGATSAPVKIEIYEDKLLRVFISNLISNGKTKWPSIYSPVQTYIAYVGDKLSTTVYASWKYIGEISLNGNYTLNITAGDGTKLDALSTAKADTLTVSVSYGGLTSEAIKIIVYPPPEKVLFLQAELNFGDVDNKVKVGQTKPYYVVECMEGCEGGSSNCGMYDSGSGNFREVSGCITTYGSKIDEKYQMAMSENGVVNYEGAGVFKGLKPGAVQVKAKKGDMKSVATPIEVWDQIANFPTCNATKPNQSVWLDSWRDVNWNTCGWNSSGNYECQDSKPASKATIQTDCDTYAKGTPVKVRYEAEVVQNLGRGSVDVCLDLYIKNCNGGIVRTMRREGCETWGGSAFKTTAGYNTVYETVSTWDMKNDSGVSVAPGCYRASATFNILYEPTVEVQFTVK